MNAEIAQRFAHDIMQKFSYELGDLVNGYPAEVHVFCVAAMKTTAAALETQLDGLDRKLLEVLTEHTTAVLLPTELDPRRKRE